MLRITLSIITKNEEAKIKRCLDSANVIVDEIILVDTGSTDNTKQIAIECGAKVYDFPWTGSFADARNYSLEQATGDWILVLDADEYLAPGSADAIKEFISGPPAIGRISQLSNYLDNGEIRYESVPISRLFPKGVYYTGSIHEQVVSDLPHRMTSVTVYHDGYFETDKTGRNIPLLEKELQKDGNNPYLLMQLAREHKNKQDYVQADYFFSQAYLYATKLEGYYPKLVVEYLYNLMKIGKLDTGYTVIQAEQNQDQLSNFPDFHFALGMFYMDYVLSNTAAHIDKLPRIEASFHKCLELGDRKEFGGIIGAGSFLAAYNLGVFYEVIGDHKKAVEYYHFSAEHDYQKAKERLSSLING
ncbi:glycosyltransferase family 2 protein [Brevibacillus brevis]|uniref:Glycosyltransferase family 2 protein n=1 Tax=Brevibacillus brevis TaxID=1393 RepID=A0A2Z4MPU9_BREBE|nr:glycosyltransferase family 2 protein [Brevibacillus brevis]AWX58575.1 glycosyltransferase family 2 protein [Brevibacillus brevis]